jgi:hypothetical protein
MTGDNVPDAFYQTMAVILNQMSPVMCLDHAQQAPDPSPLATETERGCSIKIQKESLAYRDRSHFERATNVLECRRV